MHQEQDRPSGGGQGGVPSSAAVLDQASMAFLGIVQPLTLFLHFGPRPALLTDGHE